MAGTSMPYRFSGDTLAQQAGKNNPQKKNMGMIEFHSNDNVKGLEGLSLMIKSAIIPTRAVDSAAVRLLNGSVMYPTLVQPLSDMAVVFLDYTDGPARIILENWFKQVYDEVTGLMTPPTLLKTNAEFILFGSDGLGLRGYHLEGLFPKNSPNREFDFTSGEQMEMSINFAIDRAIAQFDEWVPKLPASGPVA